MNNIADIIKSQDPFEQLYDKEFRHSFKCFCTLVCQLKNKKINLANIFIILLKEPELMNIYKELTGIDSTYNALLVFLQHDPSLYRSKYIKNFLTESNIQLSHG